MCLIYMPLVRGKIIAAAQKSSCDRRLG